MERPSKQDSEFATRYSDGTSSLVLPPDWFARDPRQIACELIGKRLVRTIDGQRLAGVIVETEAYLSQRDSASHAARGETRSNRSMFQHAGIAYVYPIHAKYCFNVVTERPGVGSAVLIRALEPIKGISFMRSRRGDKALREIANGPAKLCHALAIDRSVDGVRLDPQFGIWIEGGFDSDAVEPDIRKTARIGVTSAKTAKLRFVLRGSRFASGPKSMR